MEPSVPECPPGSATHPSTPSVCGRGISPLKVSLSRDNQRRTFICSLGGGPSVEGDQYPTMTDDRGPETPPFPDQRRTDSFPISVGPRHYDSRGRWRSNVPDLAGMTDAHPDRQNRAVYRSRVDSTTTDSRVPFLAENTRPAEPRIRPMVGRGLRSNPRGPDPSLSRSDADGIDALTQSPGIRSFSRSAPHHWATRSSWQGRPTRSSHPVGTEPGQPGGTRLVRTLAHSDSIRDRPLRRSCVEHEREPV